MPSVQFAGIYQHIDKGLTAVCMCVVYTGTHKRKLTYDSVWQAGEGIRRDGRSILPHLVDQVGRDGLKAAIARLQIDVVVLLCF